MQTGTVDIDEGWSDIVADLTRRGFLTGTATVSMAALIGCSTTDYRETTADTVAADTPFGTFDVPREPRRLLVLEGRQDLEVALALGFPRPVGLGENALDEDGLPAPYIQLDPAGITVIAAGETNLEQVIGLAPDLIIGRAMNIEPIADELAKIAPLLPVEIEGDTWQDELSTVGGWSGREVQARRALDGYQRRLDEFRESHGDKLGQVRGAVIQPWLQDGAWYSSRSNGFLLPNRVHADLGGINVAGVEESTGVENTAMLEFSAERLDLLDDADVIIAVVNGPDDEASLAQNSLWSRLPAVIQHRVVYTDFRASTGSVMAAGAGVDLWDQLYAKV